MNDFDKACRYLVKLDPWAFYSWLLGQAVPLLFREWYDPRTLPKPGERDRTGDLVGMFAPGEAGEVTAAVITEFQTENDAEILDRLNEEIARFRRELRPRGINVFGAVVNLTGPPQIAEMRMELPGSPAIGSYLRVAMLTLRDEDAAALLEAISEQRCSRALLTWAPLLRGGGESGIIQEWRALAESEPDPNRRADFGSLARNWLRLLSEPNRLAWELGLKGYNMSESPFMKEVRQEGEIANQRKVLLEAAQLRYRTTVPSDLVAAINATNNMSELDRWFKAVFTAGDFDEFRATIGR
jgi:hypothetical protein